MPNTIYHKVENQENIYWYETKKGKKFYVRINYKNTDGKWSEKTASGLVNLTAAKRKRTELKSIVDKGEASSFDANKTTFREWKDRYYKIKSGAWSKTTRKGIDSVYENHLSHFDNLTLNNVTKSLLMKNSSITYCLLETYRSLMSVIYIKKMMILINYAVDDEILGVNRLRKVKIEKIELIEKKKYLEVDEIELLEDLAKNELCSIGYACYVLMRIGWRRGEALGLKKGCVKIIDSNTIDIKVSNAKSQYEDEKVLKTNKSYRTNRLTGEYAKAILVALDEAEHIYKVHKLVFDDESRIIINRRTCKTYSINFPASILKKFENQLGHSTPHMLPHTFSTHSKKNGNDVVTVANWLGHSPKVSQETYDHVTKQSHLKLVEFANAQ